MQQEAAQPNNQSPQSSAIIRKLFLDLKPYQRYYSELYKLYTKTGFLANEGYSEIEIWAEIVIKELPRDIRSPKKLAATCKRIRAQYIKALVALHGALISLYELPVKKLDCPQKSSASLPIPHPDVIKSYIGNFDEIARFFRKYNVQYSRWCSSDFSPPPNFIEILRQDQEQAKIYHDIADGKYDIIINETKTKHKEKFWDRLKIRLEVGQIISIAFGVVIGFFINHLMAKGSSSKQLVPVSTQTKAPSTDSINSVIKSDSVSTKKSTSSILSKSTHKLQRFAKASIHYAVVDMCDWYNQLVHTFQGYLHLVH